MGEISNKKTLMANEIDVFCLKFHHLKGELIPYNIIMDINRTILDLQTIAYELRHVEEDE